MRVEEELAELRVENAGLRQQVQDMAEALKAAQQRVEELEKKKKDPPSWVKANTPKREGGEKPRRKRSPEHNRARRRMEPTRIVEHELEACPDCGRP